MNDLNIGIIGCGSIGQDHLKKINNEVQGAIVTAIFEINEETAKRLGVEYNNIEVFSSGESLIESENVNAVIVASSDSTHERYVLKAIEQKKYVLCEKPLAPEAAASKRIVDMEIKSGKQVVQVGFMRRYDSGYVAMKEALDKKAYGSPLLLHCSHRNTAIPGFSTSMAIQSCASHEIDSCRWLLNEEYVSARVLLTKNSRHSAKNLSDPQMLILETAEGTFIDIEIFVNCQYGYDINCQVVCEDGIVSLPSPPELQIKSAGKKQCIIPFDWKTRFVQAYRDELQEWVNSVKADTLNGPTAWDGYLVSITTEALIKAQKAGERVAISNPECPVFYKNK